jgi:hypothetical protein
MRQERLPGWYVLLSHLSRKNSGEGGAPGIRSGPFKSKNNYKSNYPTQAKPRLEWATRFAKL